MRNLDEEGIENDDNAGALRFTNATWLRLFHCAIEDDVVQTFCRRNDLLSHQELDARNSENRPLTFDEAAAKKFNDESFNPHSLELPKLHHDFANDVDLSLPSGAKITPEQVKKRFADVRAKAVHVIAKQEQSGNGEGAITDEDAEGFGSIRGEDREAFFHQDNRASFLGEWP